MYNTTEETYIENLIMVPVEEKHVMVQRGLELNVDQNDMNGLHQLFETSISGKISPMDIAKVTPNALKLSDMASREVGIENGWSTRRFRFMMTVATPKSNGSTFRSYVQGYTDYADTSISGMIDPKIELIFNSMINTVTILDPMTNSEYTRVSSSFTILFDRFSQQWTYQQDNETLRLLRPLDVISNLETLQTFNDGVETINTTNRHTHIPTTSSARNRTGSEHMALVLNSMKAGTVASSVGYDGEDVFSNAKSIASESNLMSIPIVARISEMQHTSVSASVTLEDLNIISPDISDNTYVIDKRQDAINVGSNSLLTNDVGSLRTVSKEATIAAMVADMATGMLIENMLTTIAFSVTNMTPDGRVVDAVTGFDSIIKNIDKTLFVDRFMAKFLNIVMPQITENNILGVEVMAFLDIAGDARVSVMLAGGVPEIYSIPVYADSLFTSVVSSPESHNRSLTEYTNLIDLVTK